MSHKSPSEDKVSAWLDENRGSAFDIACALGMKKPTVYSALMKLEAKGLVKVVDVAKGATATAHVAHIYASAEAKRLSASEVVRKAIDSQPAYARVWNEYIPQQGA